MNRNLLKSFLAIIGGVAVTSGLSIVTDLILERTGVFPSIGDQQEYGFHVWWMMLLALVYRNIYEVFGCYLIAKWAPNRPMFHAMIAGIFGLAVSIIGCVVMWDKSEPWYPIALAAFAIPCAWLGARIWIRQQARKIS